MSIEISENTDGTLAASQARSAKIEAELAANPGKFRILTGDRPTGLLHIGHYFGSLLNRVRLQNLGVESFVIIADYQTIYDRDSVADLDGRVLNAVADYLAAGIDPNRSTIFTHSTITALNQLILPFLALVTDAELRRNPTVKEELEHLNRPMSGLMLTFPVHQAADILFCKSNLVPVGKDQLPHIEITRVIARRFDERYGRVNQDQPIFPQPEALLTKATNILGMDGGKMSKSHGNTVDLAMTADETAKQIKKAKTDSERFITYDPTNRPEVANLLLLTGLCTDRDPVAIAKEIGDGGAGQLKRMLTEALNEKLAPHRALRAELIANPDHLRTVLRSGNDRASDIAEATLTEVRTAMKMVY
ncbi:MAG: tryptophan--tRNA ligase [Propionibacteriaceae bacterium]